jgi:precorrin-6B methylase 2
VPAPPILAPSRQRTWPPIVVALLLQVAAAALTVGAAWVLASVGVTLHPLVAALITGTIAAALGRIAGLDAWWMWIQLLFVPAVVLATSLPLPRWLWITLFAVLAAVYWSTFRTQVPLYLSSSKVRLALVAQLPAGQFTFMDVGSGVGGVLLDLARARPDGTYHGIESAPVPWLLSWMRIRLASRGNCHARWGSLWDCDLAPYDVVFAYLSPVPMAALWEKVQREMRPGTRFISNTFPVAGETPTSVVAVDDRHHSTLYVWTHR